MNSELIIKIYASLLLVIFGGVVLHAPLSVWLGTTFTDVAIISKIWKELLLVVAALLAIGIITWKKGWKLLLRDKLVQLIAAFAALHGVVVVGMYQGVAPTLAGLAIDLRYLLFFGLVYVLMQYAPQYRKPIIAVGGIGATIVVVFATAQVFLPADILTHIGYGKDTIAPYMTVDDNDNFIRVNSTLRGPNPLGAYAVIALSVAAAVWARRAAILKQHKKVLLLSVFSICSIVALWVSYSRSALLAAAVALLIIAVVVWGKKISWRWYVGVATIFVAVAALLAVFRHTPFVANVIFHDDQATGAEVTSNDQHAESLRAGVDRLFTSPLGEGVGTAGSASLYTDAPATVESHYFFVSHEVGIIGLLIFVAIYGLVLVRLWYVRHDWLALGVFASGVGLGLLGILLPVWADDTVSLVWWGFAGLVLGGYYGRNARK